MTWSEIFTAVCWGAFAIVSLLRFAHVLQVERYHTDSYMKWVKEGGATRVYISRFFELPLHLLSNLILLGVILSIGPYETELALLAVIALTWTYMNFPRSKNAKKPLVYTSRVKRLVLITLLLDAALVAVVTLLFGGRGMVAILLMTGYAQPAILSVANRISLPLEAFLQRDFIRTARGKLSGKKVIAVTGSYGKTGTKEAIAHMLETSFPLLKTPGSYNTPMGLCKVINEKMEPHHELFVTEMGATRQGDIRELCGLAAPSVGIITSTGEAHLESFGNPVNVAKTKFELADALPPDGILLYNGDYPLSRELARGRTQKILTYGFAESADYSPLNIRCDKDGSTFDIKTPEGTVEGVRVKLLGRLNVINVTAAFAVGRLLGVSPERLKAAAATLPQMEYRLQLLRNPGSYLVINDAFNSNLPGAEAAVETLGYFHGYKKILVTPGIVDIGEKHEETNAAFGRAAAKYCDMAILVNERRTRPIREGLLEAGFPEENIRVFPTLAAARKHIELVADEKSIVLFENDLPDHMEKF